VDGTDVLALGRGLQLEVAAGQGAVDGLALQATQLVLALGAGHAAQARGQNQHGGGAGHSRG